VNVTAIGLLLSATLALCCACSSSGGGARSTSTTTATITNSTPAAVPTSAPTPSTGTEALDLSQYAPLTMQAAPSGATVAPGTDSLVDITGGDLIISISKDVRTFADATQAIAGDPSVRFERALINDGVAMMYAERDDNGTDTYLVYAQPTRAPGYACSTRDITAGKTTIRSYDEEQARRVVAACESLQAH
jgi:hypothetical protein